MKNRKGEIVSIQTKEYKPINHKVIYENNKTIVVLENGIAGIAKCNSNDKFSRQIGYDIAVSRATIKSLENDIKKLTKSNKG